MSRPAPRTAGVAESRRGQEHAPRRAWDHAALAPVSARPPLRDYLQQLWDRRHFVRMQAFSQMSTQHQGMLLGNVWLILQPLLDGLVYWFIFGVVFNAARGAPDFLPRLIIGVLMFSYFTSCINGAASCMRGNRGLIRAFTFPRAALPLATVMRQTLSQVPVMLAMLVLIMVLPPHALPRATWLLLPVPLALMAALCLGLSFVVARWCALVPDLGKVVGYVLRLLMYGSGVIFALDRFHASGVVQVLLEINPVYLFIEITRQLLLHGVVAPAGQWWLLAGWAALLLPLGLVHFWRKEVSYGRQHS